jgi:hypothetical protein
MRGQDYKTRGGSPVTQPLPAPYGNCQSQLAALGIQLDQLHDALRAGEQARRLTTPNDPPNAAGTEDYFRRVRVLRDRMIADVGWCRSNLNQLPLVVNPARTIAVGVLLGDHQTGWVGPYHPRSKRPVGGGKIKLVVQNDQLALFPRLIDPEEVDLAAEDLTKLETWFLISYRRSRRNYVRISAELSLPSETSEDNYVIRYRRRIPLPDLRFEGVIPYVDGDDDGSDGYEVPVDEK